MSRSVSSSGQKAHDIVPAPSASDAQRVALLQAATELDAIQRIARYGLSGLAIERIDEAIEAIRGALQFQRQAAGMGRRI